MVQGSLLTFKKPKPLLVVPWSHRLGWWQSEIEDGDNYRQAAHLASLENVSTEWGGNLNLISIAIMSNLIVVIISCQRNRVRDYL